MSVARESCAAHLSGEYDELGPRRRATAKANGADEHALVLDLKRTRESRARREARSFSDTHKVPVDETKLVLRQRLRSELVVRGQSVAAQRLADAFVLSPDKAARVVEGARRGDVEAQAATHALGGHDSGYAILQCNHLNLSEVVEAVGREEAKELWLPARVSKARARGAIRECAHPACWLGT